MKFRGSPLSFISYRSDQLEFVRSVCERLLADGNSVWFDEYDIPPHRCDDFKGSIDCGIDEADWGLVFASSSYVESRHCEYELERLRRLPDHRLIVFQTTDRSAFQDRHPEFTPWLVVVRDTETLFAHLRQTGVIARIPPTMQVRDVPLNTWLLKSIGAMFTAGMWHVDLSARGTGIARREDRELDLTGELWQEPKALIATLNGRKIRLNVDCRKLDSCTANKFARRIDSNADTLRFQNDDQDDRERLREEIDYFQHEVNTGVELAKREGSVPLSNLQSASNSFEPIGIHTLNTTETSGGRTNVYKHRLYSYRFGGRLHRCYKLSLPQPQLLTPVAVRFLFQFEDDLQEFFAAIPYCDALVKSFRWVELRSQPRLTIDELRSAAQRATGERK